MISLPFQEWFTLHNLVGGDWRFFWPENLSQILSYSSSWDSSLNTGLGRNNLYILWLNSYLAFGGHFLTQILHLPWSLAEKIMFFWPIVFFSFFSAFSLSRKYVKGIYFNILSGFIYLLNPYSLMIFSGGQVGIALSYSIAPFVFGRCGELIEKCRSSNHRFRLILQNLRLSLIGGLILGLDILFEPRMTAIVILALVIFFLVDRFLNPALEKENWQQKTSTFLNQILFIFVIPGIIVVLLHSFWLLPSIFFRFNPVEQFTSTNSSVDFIKFLSFANFENTISLLHPNWPENIFGKTYFMQPEFLFLPVLAFASLLFIKKNLQRCQFILYFTLIALVGSFLAKGANPPFGELYLGLSKYLPAFSSFRDPTKFYLLVALSYSILIPFSLYSIQAYLRTKLRIRSFFLSLFLISTVCFLLFLIRPVFLGQIGGTFKFHKIPNEYTELKNFISSQPEFFRTLWIPKGQRFGYFSNQHPLISAETIFKTNEISFFSQLFEEKETENLLRELSVKYVVIPFDSESEIFLKDRRYDENQYQSLAKKLKLVVWLKRMDGFGKIAVFEVPSPKEHFWINGSEDIKDKILNIKYVNPAEYQLTLKGIKKGTVLVFSEGYDQHWIATTEKTWESSKPFKKTLNSFSMNQKGTYSVKIYYELQKYTSIGYFVSAINLFSILLLLFCLRFKKML